ncbi:CAAX geranylgeranyltransferase alpha subunit [Tulasnella sp. 403]|nr:CAAX geranylgeranyltransferase alpha subunit [Tulasnella sp. 403]
MPPIPYSLRPEWDDITPIPQADTGHVLVPILYNPEYKEAMDYFRGIVQKEEYSERVLDLTEHIIRMNPAHYSVWSVRSQVILPRWVPTVLCLHGKRQYRYHTLLKIGAPLDKELELMNAMLSHNLKTYQIWHHRRLLQTHLRDPFTELALITRTLRLDPTFDYEDSDLDENEGALLS